MPTTLAVRNRSSYLVRGKKRDTAGTLAGSRYVLLLLVSAVVCYAFFSNPYNRPFVSLLLAGAVIVVGAIPLFHWLSNPNREQVPVLPAQAFFYAVTSGVAGFLLPSMSFHLGWVGEETRQAALLSVLLCLTAMYSGYFILGSRFGKIRRNIWRFEIDGKRDNQILMIVYPAMALFDVIVDHYKIVGLRQVVPVLVQYLFFYFSYVYFKGDLRGVVKYIFIFGVIPYQLLISAGFFDTYLSGVILGAIWLAVAYAAAKNRPPYLLVIIVIIVYAAFQPIKHELRTMQWRDGVVLSHLETISLMGEMAWNIYVDGLTSSAPANKEAVNVIFDRVNQLQVLAAVIGDTPDRVPFAYGATYTPLMTKLVPRIIWPDKPVEDTGNAWAHRYGYLSPGDYTTSFNLPWLPEMYMNFGYLGVFFISAILGIGLRYMVARVDSRRASPSRFAFALVIGVPVLFPTSNFSLMFGDLMIRLVVLFMSFAIFHKVAPQIVRKVSVRE